MAASLYKWLFIPLLGIAFSSASPGKPHPFHVSVVEINHNKTDRSLEISCKIFTDDFEKILAKNYKTKTDLAREDMKTAMDTLVKKYLQSHLSINADGKSLSFNYLGYEIESEATFAYIEVVQLPSVSILGISNTILYDQFADQLNIMHVTVNGDRKSGKLNYPEDKIGFSF
jgi:hypothetical protein